MQTPFSNDMFSLVWEAFEQLYPGKKFECWFAPELESEEGEEVYGLTVFKDDGEIYVFVSAKLHLSDAVEIMAHELAHVAIGYDHGHDEAWESAFDKIHKRYEEICKERFEC